MKISILLGIFLYILGLVKLIDWFIFWNRNKQIALTNYNLFKLNYFNHFPDILKPIIGLNHEIGTYLSLIIFVISGFLFHKESHRFWKILSISSFILAGWNLFSLM